jgi:hypothetical protein
LDWNAYNIKTNQELFDNIRPNSTMDFKIMFNKFWINKSKYSPDDKYMVCGFTMKIIEMNIIHSPFLSKDYKKIYAFEL